MGWFKVLGVAQIGLVSLGDIGFIAARTQETGMAIFKR